MQWMIYGANGYTGRMMVAEAVQRGLHPVLAGRNSAELNALAAQYGLPTRVFALEAGDALKAGLSGIGLVLHCAGPFSATSAPMLEACLAAGAHYLDITGEISVFAHCHAQDMRARTAGIVVIPGTGFDVVPTDCLAAQLKARMPDAQALVLAFDAGGGPSPGTAKTSVEGLGKGGMIRENGELKTVPLAYKARMFSRDGEQRTAMTIPWGDVYTAFVSTGIGNIEVYMSVPPATVRRLQRLRWLRPLLGLKPVQNFMKAQVAKKVRGPSASTREQTGCTVWGEVFDGEGRALRRQLRTPNGYELTVSAALGIVQRLLDGPRPEPGYYTPSLLMGADYVLSLPGVSVRES